MILKETTFFYNTCTYNVVVEYADSATAQVAHLQRLSAEFGAKDFI
jgi:hypothetical protein